MAENKDSGAHEVDVARYRQAAEETLEQLDWCVSYLYRIRKSGIAGVVEQNGSLIRRRMRGDHD